MYPDSPSPETTPSSTPDLPPSMGKRSSLLPASEEFEDAEELPARRAKLLPSLEFLEAIEKDDIEKAAGIFDQSHHDDAVWDWFIQPCGRNEIPLLVWAICRQSEAGIKTCLFLLNKLCAINPAFLNNRIYYLSSSGKLLSRILGNGHPEVVSFALDVAIKRPELFSLSFNANQGHVFYDPMYHLFINTGLVAQKEVFLSLFKKILEKTPYTFDQEVPGVSTYPSQISLASSPYVKELLEIARDAGKEPALNVNFKDSPLLVHVARQQKDPEILSWLMNENPQTKETATECSTKLMAALAENLDYPIEKLLPNCHDFLDDSPLIADLDTGHWAPKTIIIKTTFMHLIESLFSLEGDMLEKGCNRAAAFFAKMEGKDSMGRTASHQLAIILNKRILEGGSYLFSSSLGENLQVASKIKKAFLANKEAEKKLHAESTEKFEKYYHHRPLELYYSESSQDLAHPIATLFMTEMSKENVPELFFFLMTLLRESYPLCIVFDPSHHEHDANFVQEFYQRNIYPQVIRAIEDYLKGFTIDEKIHPWEKLKLLTQAFIQEVPNFISCTSPLSDSEEEEEDEENETQESITDLFKSSAQMLFFHDSLYSLDDGEPSSERFELKDPYISYWSMYVAFLSHLKDSAESYLKTISSLKIKDTDSVSQEKQQVEKLISDYDRWMKGVESFITGHSAFEYRNPTLTPLGKSALSLSDLGIEAPLPPSSKTPPMKITPEEAKDAAGKLQKLSKLLTRLSKGGAPINTQMLTPCIPKGTLPFLEAMVNKGREKEEEAPKKSAHLKPY